MARITGRTTTTCGDFNPTPTWEELMHSKNLDEQLEPELNLELRKFILHLKFKNASDYQVRAYLYAPSSALPSGVLLSSDSLIKATNWIGCVTVTSDYVSRTTGRREIYVVWRGTIHNPEWITDFEGAFKSKPVRDLLKISTRSGSDEPTVHGGRFDMYTRETDDEIVPGEIIGDDIIPPVSAVVFGCLHVSNKAFKESVEGHSNLKILHEKNIKDLIPYFPGLLFPDNFVPTSTSELNVSTWKSPYLENPPELENFPEKISDSWDLLRNGDKLGLVSNQHSLEATLHVVAYWNDVNKEFENKPKVERSLALVNKCGNYLKADEHVPGGWWKDKKKDAVCWKLNLFLGIMLIDF
ncbi:phospholipase A1-IIdelta [Morus notabilis]|uniref:phospholipase A1-IIdelta n=1 Tax=Morus notabilis TaxID=981085 RepID=UPI000CED28C9|nr:phospholipase A1-IIdelta [Morus notabilis]